MTMMGRVRQGPLVGSLITDESMAEIILTGRLATRIENLRLEAYNPDALSKTKMFHGSLRSLHQAFGLEVNQIRREPHLTDFAVTASSDRWLKLGQGFNGAGTCRADDQKEE